MTMIALKLIPLDVLFFRDARPFDQADSANSRLPVPQSFYGLVKTHLARTVGLPFSRIHSLRKSNDPNRWISEIRTRGAWLYVDDYVVVPVPADIVQLGKSGDKFGRLRPIKDGETIPGWDQVTLRPLWSNQDESPRAASGFLGQDALAKYLCGKDLSKSDIIPGLCLYDFEPRTGIGVDSATMIAADSQIYSASFLRLRPEVSFYGEIEVDDPHESKIKQAFGGLTTLPWGGEGRRVSIEICEPMKWPEPPKTNGEQAGQLLSLLITPGIFGSRDGRGQNGQGENPQPAWMPRAWNSQSRCRSAPNSCFRLEPFRSDGCRFRKQCG